MKRSALFLIFILCIGSVNASTDKKIAMVFNGGGFKTAMFLGMLKGAEEAGIKPNVIIGTCGGAIPAAIAHSIDGSEKQLEFIQSEAFYNLLKSIEFTKYASVPKTLLLAKDFYAKYKLHKIIPDIFDNFLMDVPKAFNLEPMSASFTSRDHSTVIVAAKILYTKENAGGQKIKGENLFQESIFTDPVTAEELAGFTSPIAKYKNSAVTSQVNFITDANVDEAARASIADPFFMAPGEFDGDLYVTGAVDLYPIELAKKLADEIIFAYPPKFDIIERGAIYATFDFPQNERRKQVFAQSIDYLIDYTDFPTELEFTPRPDLKSGKMQSRIPKTYEKYREITRQQYNYGYTRALEAAKNRKSINHIRNH